MSRIDDMIKELIPSGVQFHRLGDIATLVRGNGMPKTVLKLEGIGAIHYGQIYTRYGAWTASTMSFVAPETAAKLATVHPGDIIITNTSENVEDVGKAVAWIGKKPIVTGGHATVIKHDQDPKFLSYWFQSESFFAQKKALATGTKVIDVSAKQLAKVQIPLPPLEVQHEIVKILDSFIDVERKLEEELKKELEARNLQYVYYRDELLDFSKHGGARRVSMGDAGVFFGGLTGKSKADFSNGNSRFVSYVNIFNNIAVDLKRDDFVRIEPGERQRTLTRGDVIFTGSSETPQDVGMSSVVTREVTEPTYLNSFSIGYRLNEPVLLDPEYAKHLFRSSAMRQQIVKTASGVTRFNVSKARLAKVEFPIPSRDEQSRIAGILDNFEALVKNLSLDLPAERVARRKQYEHYRDRLLTFDEATS